MEKNIRVGILGMGNMGKAHANSMLKISGVMIAALCSCPKEDAIAYAEENQLDCEVFEDAYEMMEEVQLDALYICLPPFAHNGQLEAAAKKGIHIFIEKPIALNLERASSMVRAVEAAGVRTQVGYHMRFGHAVQEFKKLLQSGKAGKPTLFIADYECNSLHTPWWIDVKKCGGQVFEQIIHLYDMALYIMGKPIMVSGYVANQCHKNVPGYTVEDTSISNIVFENKSLGSITGSNCSVKNEWNGRFRVICEHMVADFKDHNHAVFTFTQGEEPETEVIDGDLNALWEEDIYFIGMIRGENTEAAAIKEGFQGLEMVNGVVESSKEHGQVVRI